MCDVVYVLLLERMERLNVAITAHLLATGYDAASLVDDARAQFDDALSALPTPESAGAVLLRELGVA